MKIIEVIESWHWINIKTGQTASIYGAVPYTNNADALNWRKELRGFLLGALYIISIFLWGVRNEKNYPLYIITFLFMLFTYIFYFVFDNYIFRMALLSK